ncbi:sterol O-acyltransferase 1 isoform X2 [Sitophilus oryzae]|uniref:O-acyltransferase n=1 Tax=Sitophilus oryzae TaxID=7048 RepID=A0A6J2XJS4_SITOR|nr:sterol O-acyltransferase 1 isoform X2 [Sitophilus oryzae]
MSTNSEQSDESNESNNVKSSNSGAQNGRKKKVLPVKEFQVRDSLLTTLFDNPHIKVVKHVFIASLVGLFVNTYVHDYVEKGKVKVGLGVISQGFGKFGMVIAIWIVLNIFSILCYFCFHLWADIRIRIFPKSRNLKIWDNIWFSAVPIYYLLHFRAVSFIVRHLNMPIASSAIICLEQTRLLMKTHAFIRSNAEKVINFKPQSENSFKLASLSHYIYFLFAPTAVYKDAYPKSKTIRWDFIFSWTLEVVGVIFYYAFLLERFVIPSHKDIGLRHYSTSELFLIMCDHGTIGLLFMLVAFYVVLHVVQNLVGELLMFGDREFYKDWWTSTNYSVYFRTWNIVVSDWLYTYIYKDCYEILMPGNKTFAKVLVFFISAVVHEWVLTYMFGFFFPALFLVFLFTGSCLTFLRTPNHSFVNIMFWYIMALGSGWLVSLYSMEFYVRQNVPTAENSTLKDFIVPRLFTCNCII